MALLPPPVGCFPTRSELIQHVRNFGAEQGYGISIARSKPNKVYLICDRGGPYRNRFNLTDETRISTTGLRLINCAFWAVGTAIDGVWLLSIRNPAHNHERSHSVTAHPSLRRLDPETQQKTNEMTRAGVRPRVILSALRQNNPDIPPVVGDIYNQRKRSRREDLSDRTRYKHFLTTLMTNNTTMIINNIH